MRLIFLAFVLNQKFYKVYQDVVRLKFFFRTAEGSVLSKEISYALSRESMSP